ncbi:MAG TPA: ABC transporter permease [Streptosporangiaceae bacterium]
MSVPAANVLILPAQEVRVAGAASRRLRWLRSVEIWVPAAFLLAMLFFCFIWPLVYTVPSPVHGSLIDNNLPLWSKGHILGTDTVGDDVMARILYGGQVSFEVAAAVQAIGLVIGGALGLVAAYVGGWLDAVLMRILDVFIAFPSLVLVLAIADGLGPTEMHVIWALSAFSIPAFARVARAAALQLRDRPFVVAARLSGTKTWRILLQHLAPNMLPQLLTFTLLGAGLTMILEGGLDFLGYGIPPPTASWGNMIAAGQSFISVSPRFVFVPSIFLFVTTLALNLLGDGLRARWDAR